MQKHQDGAHGRPVVQLHHAVWESRSEVHRHARLRFGDVRGLRVVVVVVLQVHDVAVLGRWQPAEPGRYQHSDFGQRCRWIQRHHPSIRHAGGWFHRLHAHFERRPIHFQAEHRRRRRADACAALLLRVAGEAQASVDRGRQWLLIDGDGLRREHADDDGPEYVLRAVLDERSLQRAPPLLDFLRTTPGCLHVRQSALVAPANGGPGVSRQPAEHRESDRP
mmetsp:Transcript_50725/g.142013  ORF Transcript_50725/g.142013 Transcript_50725/m.142013 type:complete len:221 (-) Transcript_50725:890-1552(-)